MSQAGFTPISIYYSATASAVPLAANLVAGELALNTNDGKLYYKNASNVVTLLAGATSGPAGGSNTQVQFNSSGVLAGSANMTFNGTILTAAGFSGPLNGTVGATTPAAGSFTSLAYSTTLTGGTGIVNLGSGQFYKDASGNVGIGTSSPTEKLTVSGNTSLSGNLTFTGTGNRITGDFSNGTVANRASFQSSTTNGQTGIQAIPNGTSQQALFEANSDSSGGTNGSVGQFGVITGSEIRVISGQRGTGTYLPMTFYTGGSERVRVDTSGNVGIGNTAANVNDQVGAVRPLLVSKSDAATTVAGSQAAIVIGNSDTTTSNTSQLSFAAITGASATYFTSAAINCIFGARTNAQYPTGQLTFSTSTTLNSAPTEKMRIDSSGNVGIGTSSPAYKLEVRSTMAVLDGSANIGFWANGTSYTQVWQTLQSVNDFIIQTAASKYMSFGTNSTERMRIDSSGNVLVGQTSQTSTEKFGVTQSATGSSTARFYASSASYTNDIVQISCARSGATTEYNAFTVFDNNTTLQMLIRPNGNLLNSNNSYGSLSDVSLKENIVDATPKLDGLMQVKVRNYNLKEDVNKTKQIGVIAQELETVFPGMIETDGDGIKAVKYSVFVPMLLKAIQEQQALITSLTARITALEST